MSDDEEYKEMMKAEQQAKNQLRKMKFNPILLNQIIL